MASKFVVVVALFAVCQSSPLDEFRGRRSYTTAVGSSSAYSGNSEASAKVHGNQADAQAKNENTNAITRDGLGNGLPSLAYAKVDTSDSPGEAARFGYAQPAYYPLPAPATVHTYQKYADVPAEIPSQIVYEAQPAPAIAQSSALVNGYGSANSDANTGFGQSAASSLAQSNGPVVPVEPVVVAAKGIPSLYSPAYTPIGHNLASSSANVNGYHGSANSAARTGAVPARRSISWRFGTAYDQPGAYGAAKAAAANYGQGAAAAKSDISAPGLLSSAANTYGPGSAQSAATNNGYDSSVKSHTITYGDGRGNANANFNNANYAVLRSDNIQPGYGNLRASTNTENGGSSFSGARTDYTGNKYVDTVAKSNAGGTAQSTAYNNGGVHALRSNDAWGDRIASSSHSRGYGNAASSVNSQGLSTGLKVANAIANSGPHGSAGSNAYTF